MGLCLPLVVNKGPSPGGKPGEIVSGNLPDMLIPLAKTLHSGRVTGHSKATG
jgi:hypothetical protein